MKKVPNILKVMLVIVVMTAMVVPGAANAAVVSKVLVNGDQYSPGRYSLDLNLTGKTKYVEVKVINGDGTRKTMVSSVKVTLGSGAEKIVVISPDQFSKRKVSNVVGTLGEDIVKDMRAITLDVKVGGPKHKVKKDDADDDEKGRKGFIKRWLNKKGKTRKPKNRSIQLFVTEYFENGSPWPPATSTRPPGW